VTTRKNPLPAPAGTLAVIKDFETTENAAATPLKVTLVEPVRSVPRIWMTPPATPVPAAFRRTAKPHGQAEDCSVVVGSAGVRRSIERPFVLEPPAIAYTKRRKVEQRGQRTCGVIRKIVPSPYARPRSLSIKVSIAAITEDRRVETIRAIEGSQSRELPLRSHPEH